MTTKTCPIVEVIHEIRGGGTYIDGAELINAGVIKLGSGEEYVMDDTMYYIMSRKIELARFELSKPTIGDCVSKYKSMFFGIAGNSYGAIYDKLIETILGKKYVYNQYIQLIDLLGKMDDLIVNKVIYLGAHNKSINVSLPDIFILPHINQIIMYRPDVLESALNDIINYVNKINVNSLLTVPLVNNIPNIAKFTAARPDMKTIVSPVKATGAEEYLADMKRVLNQELEIVNYIGEIEKYHIKSMNCMNRVYEFCNKIVTDLAGGCRLKLN